jgi:predicted ester cyclase
MERAAVVAFVERWLGAVVQQKPEIFDELVAGDPGPFKLRAAALGSALSGLSASLDELVVEGDKLAWRFRVSGTHVAELAGIAPTGRHVTLTGVNFQRLEGGRVTEHWTLLDWAGLR